ncbi:hypothetical protein CC80DRAFT_6082 [Byssothecium circinans]|uniref:Uncharacterized protein n=1 Tax=Byssothecium circinans TaxID=147558 RepID=A0A6A5UQU8_9PLEO|nr:hypothetical protein CC80DRAFT_6082 [Byssothecium circinans]
MEPQPNESIKQSQNGAFLSQQSHSTKSSPPGSSAECSDCPPLATSRYSWPRSALSTNSGANAFTFTRNTCAFPGWPTGPSLTSPERGAFISDMDLSPDEPILREAPEPPRPLAPKLNPLPPKRLEKPRLGKRKPQKLLAPIYESSEVPD